MGRAFRVVLMVATVLAGCSRREANSPELQAELPQASVLSDLLPPSVSGAPLMRVDDPEVSSLLSARPGPVGIVRYINGDPRKPSDDFVGVTIALYDARDAAGDEGLFLRYPPEVAHASTALNLKDRSDDWVKENLPAWRFAVGEVGGIEVSEGVCLAGAMRFGSVCNAFYAWAQLCDGVVEVVYAPAIGEQLDSAEVKQFLEGALGEVAHARDCAR